jgi:putative Flp pilus-assembly TadE/G-like protein
MRVKTSLAHRIHDEDGVVGPFVVVTTILVFAVVVALVINGGLLWRSHISVSNATDSAALAAALTYANGQADATAANGCHAGSGAIDAASAQADAAAGANSGSTTTRQNYCVDAANGKVTVTYTMTASQVQPGSANAIARATAVWGQAGAAQTLPFMITQGAINSCNFTGWPNTPPPSPVQCTVTYDPTAPSQWGGLDLSPSAGGTTCMTLASTGPGWNVCQASIPKCAGNSAQTDSAMFPDGVFVELNTSGTTWVCADNGASTSVWANLDTQPVVGRTYCFPVTDQTQTVLTQTGAPLAYAVKGFAAFKVVSESHGGSPSHFTMTIEWDGVNSCGSSVIGPPGTGLGANAIELNG